MRSRIFCNNIFDNPIARGNNCIASTIKRDSLTIAKDKGAKYRAHKGKQREKFKMKKYAKKRHDNAPANRFKALTRDNLRGCLKFLWLIHKCPFLFFYAFKRY